MENHAEDKSKNNNNPQIGNEADNEGHDPIILKKEETKDAVSFFHLQEASNADDASTNEAKEIKEMSRHKNPISARTPVNPFWTKLTDRFIHHWIPEATTTVALAASRRPIWCIGLVTALSFSLLAIGYFTNFYLDVEQFEVFAPFGARPRSHRMWITQESGFPPNDIVMAQVLHLNGENVVGMEGIRRTFDAYEAVLQAEGYHAFCAESNFTYNNTHTCQVSTVLRFWNFSRQMFEDTMTTDEQVAAWLAQEAFPDGTPVDTEAILGNHQRTTTASNGTIVSAQSYMTAFLLPDLDGVQDLERACVDQTLPLQDRWEDDPSIKFRVEVSTVQSYADEFMRAIVKDLPLIPLVFLIMGGFTCLVFFRRDKVHSRFLLGIGAVFTICCSLYTGYGIMFICGIPFTNMTQLVPFLVFGVGLDDSYIITCAFFRIDSGKDIEERVRDTMKDIGVSISVSTMTTAFAFALGSASTVPAVRYLCAYSATTIVIDFIYQITYFMALLVLDERRIQAKRRDICIWIKVDDGSHDTGKEEEESGDQVVAADETPAQNFDEQFTSNRVSFVDRFMVWYTDWLLHPYVKGVVIVCFLLLFVLSGYSASNIRQEFEVTELLPTGSYVTAFLGAIDSYGSRTLPIYAYFRYVNQSDADMQQQMINFIDDMSDLDQFAVPRFCWVRDFQIYLEMEESASLRNLTFDEQLRFLLANPIVKEVYGDDILFNNDGEKIVASRCLLFVENLNLDVVQDQIDSLHAQREVAEEQPVNIGQSDWRFFSYDDMYLSWEFYDTVVAEWIITAVVGIVAVTAVGFVCIPHWTASFFVLPMIVMLYVDLVGIIQFSGLYINVTTYVSLAMSIGLLVDYIVHILLRYFETKGGTREEKVKETLHTIGTAILSGGMSTFLGFLPLALSTSEVMRTVFICFFAMVVLGCSHGLVFLPVVLSIVGPLPAETTAEEDTANTTIRPSSIPTTAVEEPEDKVDASLSDPP